MINKQIRVGGVNRSTPIDLKTIDSEVALLSGRATQTPIGMKELCDEVQNLKAKQYEIWTTTATGSSLKIPDKYVSWNFVPIQFNISNGGYSGKMGKLSNGYTYFHNTDSEPFSVIKDNGYLKGDAISNGSGGSFSGTTIILFYK